MRYNTPIFFQSIKKGAYNPDTGDYAPDTPIETRRYADITDSGINTIQLIYGKLKQGSKVIRLQRAYTEPFEHIRIGEKIYNVDFARWQKVFIVSEVQ